MASRPRSRSKRNWPAGLYERGGYYSWRDPRTGKELGIGRVSEGEAKAQASEANIAIAGLRDQPRLVDRVLGKNDTTWRAWLAEYERKQGLRVDENPPADAPKLAANTRKTYRTTINRIRAVYADHLELPLPKVTTRILADGLKAVKGQHARTAQAMRSMLRAHFDAAIADGWCEANPATVLAEVEVEVQRARLTWDIFKAMYERMPAGRLKNATVLALVSGQPRETVCAGLFTEIGAFEPPGQPAVECWMTTRGKTGAKIAIPLDLRLNVLGMSLRDVVKQCRATGVASRYLVHATQRAKGQRIGAPYQVDRLSKDFTAAMEALTADLAMDWAGKTPPTFHELRSLSKRLYEAQGGVDTKDLLGHATDAMGELYEDGRGAEFKLVSINQA
jgi:hypothetical protein